MINCNNRKVYTSEPISKYSQFKNISIPKELLEPQFELSFLNSEMKRKVTKAETQNTFTEKNNQVYLSFYK